MRPAAQRLGERLAELAGVRAGEGARVAWVAAIALAYAAATALGDSIAESVFVARAGADALPRMFLLKGAVDVVAAALYLPITRGRSATRVWQIALGIYVAAVLGTGLAATSGTALSAYALYIGHECAWTILTIHWGVLLLEVFDASQARRLLPLLFTAAQLGRVVAGLVLDGLAVRVGALSLLAAAALFALAAGLMSRRSHWQLQAAGQPATPPAGDRSPPPETPPRTLLGCWRQAASSPLVRAIAVSTAAMVMVRYGLRMVSIGEVTQELAHDEDAVAGFLGSYGAVANSLGVVLGVLVVPRLIAALGVTTANLLYALATVAACGSLAAAPSLATAVLARFTEQQLKDALKTPLSALFYGAELPHRRAQARAFIFGAVIPGATMAAAGLFELCARMSLDAVAWAGSVAGLLFVVASAVQNRRWRIQLGRLLAWMLERQAQGAAAQGSPPAPTPDAVAQMRRQLRQAVVPHTAAAGQIVDPVALVGTALSSPCPAVRALTEELIAELVPLRRRARARALARALTRDEPGPMGGPGPGG